MIKPICDLCKKELNNFGALLFSIPIGGLVRKYHICQNCFKKILEIRENNE